MEIKEVTVDKVQPLKQSYFHMTSNRQNLLDANGEIDPNKLEPIMSNAQFQSAINSNYRNSN